ncbi:hypothetical protein AM493_14595 [Flavobacterium akiainvivens]|uniref:Uncharacterized protein n=1 Tax=Flavobacterium akiainvivens TaxID=1202724 RepID=A0A0M8MIW3_9FLAO|nr:hypothetical protein [Flavobacterium akiainvivens]KOS07131.1 hypothetical protein AM493_14595 [Flavobacterium akiainvivens]SFQ75921.1 hypothetical protein SAMN05444144_12249 [Flavobacterium akiainvivens]
MKTLLLALLFNIACFAQSNINGTLVLNDPADHDFVVANAWVILQQDSRIDSTRVDNNLHFVFKNVTHKKPKLKITPRHYPVDTSYDLNKLKEGENEMAINYSPTCPFGKTGKVCPVCHKSDDVIPIRYGLIASLEKKGDEPDKTPAKRTYKPGGCVVSDCQPEWHCEHDDRDF